MNDEGEWHFVQDLDASLFHKVEGNNYETNHNCTGRFVEAQRMRTSEGDSIFYWIGVHLESQGHVTNNHGYSYSQIAGDNRALKEWCKVLREEIVQLRLLGG